MNKSTETHFIVQTEQKVCEVLITGSTANSIVIMLFVD
jgi:hypothetical protein